MKRAFTRTEKKNAFVNTFPYRCIVHNFGGRNAGILEESCMDLNFPFGTMTFSYSFGVVESVSFAVAAMSLRHRTDIDHLNLILDTPLIEVPLIWDRFFTIKTLETYHLPRPFNQPGLSSLTNAMRRSIKDNFHTRFEF